MHIHAGRSALLVGTVLSLTAPGFTSAVSEPLGDRPGFESRSADAVLEVAQGYGFKFGDGTSDTGYGAPKTDEAGLLLRIDRLESQIRQLTGQIEQMQHMTRKLEEQLKKFQEDVEFRFQESGGHGGAPAAPGAKSLQRRSEAEPPAELAVDDPLASLAEVTEAEPAKGRPRRSDAFDPASDPTAPGAPRPLGSPGSTRPSLPLGRSSQVVSPSSGLDGRDPDAPLDLSGAKLGAAGTVTSPEAEFSETPTRPLAATQPRPAGLAGADAGSVPARPAADPAREEFDLAFGLLKAKQYENAEQGFAAFLQKYPKSKLASDALYYLGESYFQRGRQREAAEQYLKVSTTYAGSSRAPSAFLRLGQSLNALGAKDQACAAYAEIGRKYPNASQSVKAGAEREAKRARC